jgi:hypothetical protein
MIQHPEWDIRISTPEDLSFIYATCAQSYHYGSLIGKGCKDQIFYKEYYKVMDWIFNQDDVQIKVACNKNDAFVVFGYIIFQPSVVHYIYTKQDFRNFGIALSLYEASGKPKLYSQKTVVVRPILRSHPDLKIDFNPFLLFHQYELEKETK